MRIFSFPDPVAGGVLLLSVVALVRALLVCVIGAATLESVFAICLGCHALAFLMRLGVIPESVCERCAELRA